MSAIPPASSTYVNASGTPPSAPYQYQAPATPPQTEVQESNVPPSLPAGMVMVDAVVLAQLMTRAAQVQRTMETQAPAAPMSQPSPSPVQVPMARAVQAPATLMGSQPSPFPVQVPMARAVQAPATPMGGQPSPSPVQVPMARAVQAPATPMGGQLSPSPVQVPMAGAVPGPTIPMNPLSISNYIFTEGHTSGATYVGEMQNGLPHGKGTKTYLPSHDSITYTGDFVEGRLEGEGVLISRNKNQYSGQFKGGLYHGKGRLDYSRDGGYQIGIWEGGVLKDGEGIICYEDKTKYSGQFKNNERHGKGKYEGERGQCMEGTWENDSFVEGTNRWQGTQGRFWTYTGTYKNGKEWTGKNTMRQEWRNGKQVTECVVS